MVIYLLIISALAILHCIVTLAKPDPLLPAKFKQFEGMVREKIRKDRMQAIAGMVMQLPVFIWAIEQLCQ